MTNKVIDVMGEPVEVLVSSKSTNNAFCVAVQTSPPGGGPPPHMHGREDEMFYVLEGDYEIFDGEEWRPMAAGECRIGMRGGFHAFRNAGTTTGRMMFMVTPGGLDEYFAEISPLSLPADADRLEEINRVYGITFAPPDMGK